MPKPITQNTLFYGDNLPILREHFPDECIDLIYLDPPFNSSRSYNVLFKEEGGLESDAQITAFEDTWHWNAATERTYHEMIQNSPANVARMIGALREFVGTNQMMAYLVMMATRLVELQRVLKPTVLYICIATQQPVIISKLFWIQFLGQKILGMKSSGSVQVPIVIQNRVYGILEELLTLYSFTQKMNNQLGINFIKSMMKNILKEIIEELSLMGVAIDSITFKDRVGQQKEILIMK
jgi:site-specific DNA-methyltransferase (adenine-specific)